MTLIRHLANPLGGEAGVGGLGLVVALAAVGLLAMALLGSPCAARLARAAFAGIALVAGAALVVVGLVGTLRLGRLDALPLILFGAALLRLGWCDAALDRHMECLRGRLSGYVETGRREGHERPTSARFRWCGRRDAVHDAMKGDPAPLRRGFILSELAAGVARVQGRRPMQLSAGIPDDTEVACRSEIHKWDHGGAILNEEPNTSFSEGLSGIGRLIPRVGIVVSVIGGKGALRSDAVSKTKSNGRGRAWTVEKLLVVLRPIAVANVGDAATLGDDDRKWVLVPNVERNLKRLFRRQVAVFDPGV